jgi:hypothetical protein
MSFKDFLVNEGAQEAQRIRTALKKELKLTNRDVSVKARSGSMSSAVNVNIKNMKALQLKTKIEEIGTKEEYYTRDEATGEILGGGNTFIFTEIDYKFRQELADKIQKEFDKVNKKTPLEDMEHGSIKLFKTFEIIKPSNGGFFARLPKKNVHSEIRDIRYISGAIFSLISQAKNDKLFLKIK